jgi:hypothetical protein
VTNGVTSQNWDNLWSCRGRRLHQPTGCKFSADVIFKEFNRNVVGGGKLKHFRPSRKSTGVLFANLILAAGISPTQADFALRQRQALYNIGVSESTGKRRKESPFVDEEPRFFTMVFFAVRNTAPASDNYLINFKFRREIKISEMLNYGRRSSHPFLPRYSRSASHLIVRSIFRPSPPAMSRRRSHGLDNPPFGIGQITRITKAVANPLYGNALIDCPVMSRSRSSHHKRQDAKYFSNRGRLFGKSPVSTRAVTRGYVVYILKFNAFRRDAMHLSVAAVP